MFENEESHFAVLVYSEGSFIGFVLEADALEAPICIGRIIICKNNIVVFSIV
jgi:hypothetical protein